MYAILYNGFAFAFQMPIGALADRLGTSTKLAAVGCVMVAAGVFLKTPWLLCLCIGIGNACFHVGAAREVLHRGNTKAAMVGFFVAPGALGIFLGPLSASVIYIRIAAVVALLLCSFVILLSESYKEERIKGAFTFASVSGVLCMFMTVLIRSYMGTILNYDFKSVPLFMFVFTICIFCGKFIGGVLSDKFGSLRFSVVAQLLFTALLVLSMKFQFAAMPAILLCNTSMAVTAAELYKKSPSNGGFLFGVTTFALYLGIIPGLLKITLIPVNAFTMLLIGLLSSAFLIAGIRLLNNE
ncbi:MAG: hypothetical protein IJH37_07505 [Clostridia bacterium]|nr:hypothetical protein [Clostridia bacterium]